ncbi:MAG: hypothetical protein LQ346_003215 [Caloplaca aetnensis]|nr:MAG: hypothetical protein LQ346_003215 [Caloplaca aetnensis]
MEPRVSEACHAWKEGAFGASVPSIISLLDPSAAVKLQSLKSFTYEPHTLQTGLAVPPTVVRSVTPTARRTLDLAAPAMAIVGILLLTVGLAANLAAQLLLLQRAQPPLDLMAVVALPSVVPLVTPMVPLEAAARRMAIAAKQPITAVPDVKADAMAEPEEHQAQLRQKPHHPRLPKSPSLACQPLDPSMARPLLMEPVAPRTAFCGKTTAHCDEGCQSGPCTGTPAVPAPGPKPAPANPNPGYLALASRQAGVPAMHAGLMPNGKVVFLDKVENNTQIGKFQDGGPHNNQYAYSVEYDPVTMAEPQKLGYSTNAFCSGGAFLADGRFVSIGGNAPLDFIDPTVGNGFKSIRFLDRPATRTKDGQPWVENTAVQITSERWYASVQTMPDGTLFVASGSLNGLDPTVPENNNPTYEILTAQGLPNGRPRVPMEILKKNQPYYMYPFIHLLNNGQLFIAVAKSAEIFNVATNAVVKLLPDIPGDFRTYPNTGGSVLLPLSSKDNYAPEVMICGGGAYQDITSPTDASCGRMRPLDAAPKWEMDAMPEGRGMVEGTLLPDGTVIWLNGAKRGAQGFGVARDPAYEVLIYDPSKSLTPTDPSQGRWSTGPVSGIARLYHSVALLLLDGTLMIAGSNPVEQPKTTPSLGKVPSEEFVTEYRVGIYTPPYLAGPNASKRPTALTLSSKTLKADGSTFTVKFTAPAGNKAAKVALYHGGFVTHSLHMNHRMVFLDTTGYQAGATSQTLTVKMPPNRNVAQPGPYVVYVTVDGVPAIGQFVMVG